MTENPEEKIPTPEEELEIFRDEIVAKAESELVARGTEKATGHFSGLPVERGKISERDLQFAKKIKAGTVTYDDVEEYRAGVSEEMKREIIEVFGKASLPQSTEARVHGYLINTAVPVMARRETEERKNKK